MEKRESRRLFLLCMQIARLLRRSLKFITNSFISATFIFLGSENLDRIRKATAEGHFRRYQRFGPVTDEINRIKVSERLIFYPNSYKF